MHVLVKMIDAFTPKAQVSGIGLNCLNKHRKISKSSMISSRNARHERVPRLLNRWGSGACLGDVRVSSQLLSGTWQGSSRAELHKELPSIWSTLPPGEATVKLNHQIHLSPSEPLQCESVALKRELCGRLFSTGTDKETQSGWMMIQFEIEVSWLDSAYLFGWMNGDCFN